MLRPSRIVLAGLVVSLAACSGTSTPGDAATSPAPVSAPAASPSDATGPVGPTSVQAGVYTAPQAERGGEVFGAVCGECHATREFRGADFMFAWGGSSVGRFVERVMKTMPENAPGSLETRQYVDVAAYVLSLNGFPTGEMELTTDTGALDLIVIEGATP